MNRSAVMMVLAVMALGAFPGCYAPARADDARADAVGGEEPARPKEGETMETAIFGAGCFWGVEAAFRRTPGVTATEVGYSGGKVENPSYQDVCTGRTGHAEVVRVTYDPERVSYDALLAVFWQCHDPTQKNRQGPDIGAQYRSVIFFQNSAQEEAARAALKALSDSGAYPKPIVTEIVAAKPFYRAEDYHQQYLEKRGLATCHIP